IRRRSLGQLDTASGEKRAHAVVARLSVDVLLVVGVRVERLELLAGPRGALAQVRVEHLLPGRRMHDGGRCQHAVEVAEARADLRGRSEALRGGRRCHRPGSDQRRKEGGGTASNAEPWLQVSSAAGPLAALMRAILRTDVAHDTTVSAITDAHGLEETALL